MPGTIVQRFFMIMRDSVLSDAVFRKKIDAVLIHADSFFPRLFRQRSVKCFRKSQLELTGIGDLFRGFFDFDMILDGRLYPRSFRIIRVCCRFFDRISASQATGKLGKRCNVSALINVSNDFHSVRQTHIIIKCFHFLIPRFQLHSEPYQHILVLSAHVLES